MGGGLDEVFLSEDPDAHRIDEGISGIAGREIDFTTEGRHTDAVAVVADAAHHAREQIAVPRLVERAEAEAVEQRDGPSAHREDVAQNPAGPCGRALVGLHGGGVIVRLDLERDCPAVRKSQDAGVFTGALHDLRPGRGEAFEDGSRVLVGAVLAPQRRENPQLGERGRPAEQREDAFVFFGCEVVFLHQLGGDLRIDHDRVTPFATARNIRAKMLFDGVGRLSIAFTSSASHQMPWQLVHCSICTPSQSPVIRS